MVLLIEHVYFLIHVKSQLGTKLLILHKLKQESLVTL